MFCFGSIPAIGEDGLLRCMPHTNLLVSFCKDTELCPLLNQLYGEPFCEIGGELQNFILFGNVDLLVTSIKYYKLTQIGTLQ